MIWKNTCYICQHKISSFPELLIIHLQTEPITPSRSGQTTKPLNHQNRSMPLTASRVLFLPIQLFYNVFMFGFSNKHPNSFCDLSPLHLCTIQCSIKIMVVPSYILHSHIILISRCLRIYLI